MILIPRGKNPHCTIFPGKYFSTDDPPYCIVCLSTNYVCVLETDNKETRVSIKIMHEKHLSKSSIIKILRQLGRKVTILKGDGGSLDPSGETVGYAEPSRVCGLTGERTDSSSRRKVSAAVGWRQGVQRSPGMTAKVTVAIQSRWSTLACSQFKGCPA